MASERQIEDEDVGQELSRHFEEDDRQIVSGNVQLTKLIESSSYIKLWIVFARSILVQYIISFEAY